MAKQIFCVGLLALAVQAGSAQTRSAPLGTPLAGIVREPDHTLRSVYGVAANLITGHPLPLRDVEAASFSDEAGIVLSSGAVKLVNLDGTERASYPTAESQPVLSIAQGPETAVAWLPGEQKLIRWTRAGFIPVPVEPSRLAGPIVQMQMTAPAALDLWLRIQTDTIQHVRVSLANGAITPLETTAGISSPVSVAGPSLLFYDSAGHEIQSSPAPTHALPLNLSTAELPGLTFENASSNWIHISSASTGRQWMLHFGAPGVSLCALPAAPAKNGVEEGQ
jgi:hypothetical protein